LPTKGAQNIPLIPALYALLNPDDGSDHPKSNLLGRVRPGHIVLGLRGVLCAIICPLILTLDPCRGPIGD